MNEVEKSLNLARARRRTRNFDRALKLLNHALQLDPTNSEIINLIGEILEELSHGGELSTSLQYLPNYLTDLDASSLIEADRHYMRAYLANPDYEGASLNLHRTSTFVLRYDKEQLDIIDNKLWHFHQLPDTHPGLRRAKLEHFFRHIYHTNAMEGNTLSLAETRSILETRVAVGGRSLIEQNEVLGIDAALRYLNSTLLRDRRIGIEQILELHRRVLGFVDISEAGRFRSTQVLIADHTPPSADLVAPLMDSLVEWINSDEASTLHPIELAAITHWKLVYIHPFYDGNGRTARLLMNWILMRSGIPPAILKVETRARYFRLLSEANSGDLRPFIRFIMECTADTLDEYLQASGAAKATFSTSAFTVEDSTSGARKKFNLTVKKSTALSKTSHYPFWMLGTSSRVPTEIDIRRRISYLEPSADYIEQDFTIPFPPDEDDFKRNPMVIYL
ncbi:hypothetical protein Ciccas_004106 [Cichlidogyrus casuarinus]|uniref:protein adenylyltransferase n=1 Tax=Cichlidogyrus casuarinus TaxID=1844966 RepID=A0ABD2QFU5_9PLAT